MKPAEKVLVLARTGGRNLLLQAAGVGWGGAPGQKANTNPRSGSKTQNPSATQEW